MSAEYVTEDGTGRQVPITPSEPNPEFCHSRDRHPDGRWCGHPAEFIIWGKLFPPQALGPRCYECAVRDLRDGGYPSPELTISEIGGPRSPAIYRLPT